MIINFIFHVNTVNFFALDMLDLQVEDRFPCYYPVGVFRSWKRCEVSWGSSCGFSTEMSHLPLDATSD
jgi:hypothetical protein